MQNRSPKSLAIFVMTILVLVPVFQALPLNLPPLLPEASAQGSISLLGAPPLKTGSTDASNKITIMSVNAGTGSSRLLVVAVQASGASVNSITFAGSGTALPLTQASGSFQHDYTAFWYLRNPVGTGTVTITMSGAAKVIAGAYSFSGVDQANPIPTTATNFTKDNPPVQPNPTISITTKYSNSTVLDSAALFGGSTLSGTGCGTTGWSTKDPTATVTGASSYKTQASAGTVTCKWTNSVSNNGWDDTAIEIKAAGIDNQVTPITLTSKSTASGFVPLAGGPITLYKFNPGSGANRLLVVGVAADSQSVSGITFGGVALTQRVKSFLNNDAELWYLKNPSSTPADLVVTMAGGTGRLSQFVVGAYAFSGVDQTNPITNTAAKNNTAASSPTITITTRNANDWVVDQPSIYGGSTLSSPKCLQQWNSNVQYNSSRAVTGASSSLLVPTARTVTCSWTASPTDFWDDVAVDIHAVSLPTSTGILEPTYIPPYSGTTFNWQPLINAHQAHPKVPFFAIVNPNNGPCSSNNSPCDDNQQYADGIGNLTKAGIIVLGYIYTGNANATLTNTCCPYVKWSKGNVTEWANMYGPKNATLGNNGVAGIFFDQMANAEGTANANLDYYQNLTNYTKSLGFKYAIGNPGINTTTNFVSHGASDTLDIFETFSKPSSQGDLLPLTFAATKQGFDKHNFSFLSWNQTTTNGGLPNNATLGNYSNYVGLFYLTDNPGCGATHPCFDFNADPWNTTASYLTNMVKALDRPASVITINATDASGNPITGAFVKISQNGSPVPSGFAPFSYLGTQTVKYLFTPQNYSPTCTFHNWKYGSTTAARTITINSTSAAFTLNYTGTGCP